MGCSAGPCGASHTPVPEPTLGESVAGPGAKWGIHTATSICLDLRSGWGGGGGEQWGAEEVEGARPALRPPQASGSPCCCFGLWGSAGRWAVPVSPSVQSRRAARLAAAPPRGLCFRGFRPPHPHVSGCCCFSLENEACSPFHSCLPSLAPVPQAQGGAGCGPGS